MTGTAMAESSVPGNPQSGLANMEDGKRRLSLPSATRLNGCTKQLAGSPCPSAPCSLLSPCQESSSY